MIGRPTVMMPDVKLPKKLTRDGWRIVIANWSLDRGLPSEGVVTEASSGTLGGLMASRFSERRLESSKVSLDPDEFGKVTTGNGWSSITSVVKVEVILTNLTRADCLGWRRARVESCEDGDVHVWKTPGCACVLWYRG